MDLLTIFEANIEYIMKRMEFIEKFWSKYWIYNEKNGFIDNFWSKYRIYNEKNGDYWEILKQISNI